MDPLNLNNLDIKHMLKIELIIKVFNNNQARLLKALQQILMPYSLI